MSNKSEWRPGGWKKLFPTMQTEPANCTLRHLTNYYEAGASAMLKAALEWLGTECIDLKHDGGYWEGGGLDCNGSPIKGKFHYDKRFNCPQCLNELKESIK